MASILGEVLTRYKADTRDHKRKLKDLRGAEKKRHKALIDDLERENAQIDDQIAMWGKVAIGIGAVVGAIHTAREAWRKYAEVTRLQTATMGVQVNKLQESFRGLITRTETMRFAAAAANGEFKSTNEELRVGAKLALVLAERTGRDLREAIQAVSKAFTEGNTEGLKEWGLQIRGQSDTLKQYNHLIERAKEVVRDHGKATKIAGEDMQRAAVKGKDAMDELKTSIGQLVNAAAPLVRGLSMAFKGLAAAITEPVNVLKNVGSFATGGNLFGTDYFVDEIGYAQNLKALAAYKKHVRQERALRKKAEERIRGGDKKLDAIGEQIRAAQAALDAKKKKASDAKRGSGAFSKRLNELLDAGFQRRGNLFFGGEGERGPRDDLVFDPRRGVYRPVDSVTTAGSDFGILGQFGGLTPPPEEASGPGLWAGIGQGIRTQADRQASFRHGGAFDMLKNQGQQAISMFASTSSQAFQQIITGAQSASKAIKQAFGQMIMAQSMDLFAKGISQGVQALIHLVSGNPAAAAGAGKASASAFAGAATLGAMAQALGVGSKLPGKPSGLGGSASGAQGPERTNRTIIIGNGFGDEDPRRRAARIRRALDADSPDTTFIDG